MTDEVVFPSVFADPAIDMPAAEVEARVAAGELLLIDIREDYEWEKGRARGARHIAIDRVASRAPELPRDRPIAFICRGGVRAGMVATAFKAVGYDARNVRGGFTAWHAAGLPSEPDGAVVADH